MTENIIETDKKEALSVADVIPEPTIDIALTVIGYVGEVSVVEELAADELKEPDMGPEEPREKNAVSYDAYKRKTPLEKAQTCGFNRIRSQQMVQNIVKFKFMDMEHNADVNELIEETELLYKGMCELVAKIKAEEVLEEVKRRGIPFEYWTTTEKTEILQFQLDNNAYNVKLYLEKYVRCVVLIHRMIIRYLVIIRCL